MKTRDIDVRRQLHQALSCEYKDDPDTVIFDELCICHGEARIDVAVVNGAMHGYEIKSESDTLERLPKQMEVYNKVFDTVVIVTGSCHLEQVYSLAPEWWGIYLATSANTGDVRIEPIRPPQQNTEFDAFSLAQFLWRDEILELLTKYGIDKGVRKFPKFKLWHYLSENIPVDELKSYVRDCLKVRKDRIADLQRKSNGD